MTSHIVWNWLADCSRLVVLWRQRSCLHNCCTSNWWVSECRQNAVVKDCRQAEEPKQLVDEASRFHLGAPVPILCGHLLWRFAIQQQSTAPKSGHTLLTQVRSMCSWTLPCASCLVPSVLHLSRGFQCSPTLNHQPYEGRLPLTSWWRKSSNMTVGQSSLILLAHHCYDWHPGSCCGWTCSQLTSKVDGGITGLRWSILT